MVFQKKIRRWLLLVATGVVAEAVGAVFFFGRSRNFETPPTLEDPLAAAFTVGNAMLCLVVFPICLVGLANRALNKADRPT